MYNLRKHLGVLLVFLFAAVIIIPAVVVKGLFPAQPEVRALREGTVVRVFFHETGKVETVLLEDYLVGVVAAEMPALFHEEALKAQAVAARTYALKKRMLDAQTEDRQHPNADLCTDPSHCQGWLSDQGQLQRWGLWHYWRYRNKITSAVEQTSGLVLTYNEQLIDPVYHANSGGFTEDAGAVWQNDIPYLRSVKSPWDVHAPNYRETVSFSLEELDRRLGTSLASIPVSQGNQLKTTDVKIKDYTASGRVKTIIIGSREFTGKDLRQLLGLRSANFTCVKTGGEIVFTTFGHGHGVGMSQYGAQGMAAEGYSFRDILAYYYPGTRLNHDQK